MGPSRRSDEIPLHNLSNNLASSEPLLDVRLPVAASNVRSLSADYCTKSPEEAAAELRTSLQYGLDAQEALRRRAIHGPNELPQSEEDSLYVKFAKQFVEQPLILLLLASALISFLMGNLDDAISITLAVAIVVSVGFVQEYRSEKSLEALNKLVPHYAHLLRARSIVMHGSGLDGGQPEITKMTVMATQLVPGDLVAFSTGDRIPADIRITQANGLEIDESNLTGENEAVKKTADAVPPRSAYASTTDVSISERNCIAFMGTLVRHGNGQGIVVSTGAKTEFGVISEMLAQIDKPRTPLQSTMDKLGKDLSMASFGVIGIIIVIGLIQGREWLDMFQIGVSLAVAAIPEGLPIIVTVTLALGVLRMVKRGGIVRRLPSVETLGCVSVVCSDKTGTLTLNHMTVTKLWTNDLENPVEKEVLTADDAPPNTAVQTILRIGNICNNGHLAADEPESPNSVLLSDENDLPRTRFIGQPTDVALLDLLDAFGETDVRPRIKRISELPFSSARKWMGVLTGKGLSDDGEHASKAYIKGAVEYVLARCDAYLTKDGKEVILDEPRRLKAIAAAEQMAAEGLRVLGFATGNANTSGTPRLRSGRSTPAVPSHPNNEDAPYNGLTFAGLVGMYDPPRPGVDKAIRRLVQGGVKVMMITGDAETTAVAIGRKLGMPLPPPLSNGRTKGVLKGEDLDGMTEGQLAESISATSIFARATPEHKMKIVRALQARGEVVAMTGDGVNDAPALKMADIGVAMGQQGTDVAKEAADMILSNDDFSTILAAIEEGKGIFYNIQNFLTFQLSTSVAALSLVLLSTFFKLDNPLNAMQILWINIIMDGPPAQSLGVEPVDPAVMSRPPRSRSAQIITRALIQRVLMCALIVVVGTMGVYVYEMQDNVVTARDTTMTFTCFVLFDMFNALSCRSEGKSVLFGEIELFGNKMFNYSVAGSLICQLLVIYFPPLQSVFQTEGLYFKDLCGLVLLSSTVFWADEARKYMAKRNQWSGRYSTNV